MEYTKEEFAAAFASWQKRMKEYHLPAWEELPVLDLYMDQVTILMNQYLEIFNTDRSDDMVITHAMINNYVKMKLIPPPVKKRYNRIHLAYLMMLCSLKQTLSMEVIRRIIPVDLTEEEVRVTYTTFAEHQTQTFDKLIEYLEQSWMMAPETPEKGDLRDLVLQAAIFSNLSRTMTRMILELDDSPSTKGKKAAEESRRRKKKEG